MCLSKTKEHNNYSTKYSYFTLECDAQKRDWVKDMAIKDVLLSTLNPENMNLAPVLVSKLRSNFNESRLFLPLKIVKLCYCNNSNNWGNMNQSIKINYLIEIKDS
jgi:hypothetical protein